MNSVGMLRVRARCRTLDCSARYWPGCVYWSPGLRLGNSIGTLSIDVRSLGEFLLRSRGALRQVLLSAVQRLPRVLPLQIVILCDHRLTPICMIGVRAKERREGDLWIRRSLV